MWTKSLKSFSHKDYSCDIELPRVKKRWTLKATGVLEPRRSALEDYFKEEEEKEEDDQPIEKIDAYEKGYYRGQSPRDKDRRHDSYKQHKYDLLLFLTIIGFTMGFQKTGL